MIDKVSSSYKRIAIDNNEYLIEALKVIRDNPEILPKNENKKFKKEVERLRLKVVKRIKRKRS